MNSGIADYFSFYNGWQSIVAIALVVVIIAIISLLVSSDKVQRRICCFERKHRKFFRWVDKHNLIVNIFIAILVVCIVFMAAFLVLSSLSNSICNQLNCSAVYNITGYVSG